MPATTVMPGKENMNGKKNPPGTDDPLPQFPDDPELDT